MQCVQIVHCSGKSNANANALSGSPRDPSNPPQGLDVESYVAAVSMDTPKETLSVSTSIVSDLLVQPYRDTLEVRT